jgi:hypothetical protein
VGEPIAASFAPFVLGGSKVTPRRGEEVRSAVEAGAAMRSAEKLATQPETKIRRRDPKELATQGVSLRVAYIERRLFRVESEHAARPHNRARNICAAETWRRA